MDDNSNLSQDRRRVRERLLEPAMTFTHPEEVLHTRILSGDEKRELLASWASDVHAVPGLPTMRQLDSGAIVSIDTVLAALQALDADGDKKKQYRHLPLPRSRATLIPRRRPFRKKGGRDDDDDPPPCPAAILPPGVELALRHRCEREQALAAA